MGLINYDAKEIIFEKIKEFRLPDEELAKLVQMRKDFISLFTEEKIKHLTPDGYFPGLGKKDDCIGY